MRKSQISKFKSKHKFSALEIFVYFMYISKIELVKKQTTWHIDLSEERQKSLFFHFCLDASMPKWIAEIEIKSSAYLNTDAEWKTNINISRAIFLDFPQ